jgi:hypothetical protein
MPVTIPENPRLANDSERRVWEILCSQLADGDLLVAGKRVTDHLKDHEIDFVVAIEGAGIFCIEVKGGEVWHNGTEWLQAQPQWPCHDDRSGQAGSAGALRAARLHRGRPALDAGAAAVEPRCRPDSKRAISGLRAS